ncbi:MAG: hypothetical protein SGARI_007615, partial [Bacillariaceae sp.]
MGSSKAASKTKLKAMRNNTASRPKITTADGKAVKPEQRFLSKLMERYVESEGDAEKAATSFATVMAEWGMNDRNAGHRKVWAAMISDKEYIESASS